MKFHNIICTFFGIGKIKFAPGTFGSLAAIPIWTLIFFPLLKFGLITFFGFWVLFIASLFLIGVRASDNYSKETGKKDASEIVIDEVVGQLISLFVSFILALIFLKFLPITGNAIGIYFHFPLLFLLMNFIFFRLFDILKPGWVGYADKNFKGGMGVMLDDVIAGLFTAPTVIASAFLLGPLFNLFLG